jgi:hypothetical protein
MRPDEYNPIMRADEYNKKIVENICKTRESILPLTKENIAKFAGINSEHMDEFEVEVNDVPNLDYKDGDMQTSLDGNEYVEKSGTLQVVELKFAGDNAGSFIIDGNEFHTIAQDDGQRKFFTKVDGSGMLVSQEVERIDNPTSIDRYLINLQKMHSNGLILNDIAKGAQLHLGRGSE